MKKTKIAVVGAGNGGCAMAAYFSLQGAEVRITDVFPEYLDGIQQTGRIHLIGAHGEGFAKLHIVTDNPQEVVVGADLIMVVTPAFTHELIARAIAPALKDGQIVVLNPGRTAGALNFLKTLRSCDCKTDIIVAETQTLLYACRKTGPASVKIAGIKGTMEIASIPANKIDLVMELLRPYYPQFSPYPNTLYTSFNNTGILVHPAPILLNIGWVELSNDFDYYRDGISPTIADFIVQLDVERRNVAAAIEIKLPDTFTHFKKLYPKASGDSLYELLHNNEAYLGIKAPKEINTRYVTEEIPTGMVPFSDFGGIFGIATPIIDTITNLANCIYRVDFRENGRTIRSLGLEGKDNEQIKQIFINGY